MEHYDAKKSFSIDNILQTDVPERSSTPRLLKPIACGELSGRDFDSSSFRGLKMCEPALFGQSEQIVDPANFFYKLGKCENFKYASLPIYFSKFPPFTYAEHFDNIRGFHGNSSYNFNAYGLCIPPSATKRKGGQIRFTSHQTKNLENSFAVSKYLSPEDRKLLALQLKLTDRQVKTWFQNRRAKWRRSCTLKKFSTKALLTR